MLLVAGGVGVGVRKGVTTKFRASVYQKWYARQGSNLQPLGPKPSALSIELRARLNPVYRSFDTGDQAATQSRDGVSGGIRTHGLLDHNQAP